MVKVNVELHAFGSGGKIREVEIPDEQARGADNHALLELAFRYGQEDFQPRQQRSVSVDDVVVLPDGSRHKVLGCGWELLS